MSHIKRWAAAGEAGMLTTTWAIQTCVHEVTVSKSNEWLISLILNDSVTSPCGHSTFEIYFLHMAHLT